MPHSETVYDFRSQFLRDQTLAIEPTTQLTAEITCHGRVKKGTRKETKLVQAESKQLFKKKPPMEKFCLRDQNEMVNYSLKHVVNINIILTHALLR